MNEVLTQSFDIPCRVWWGGDLDRRLERFGDIKWSYPELLDGSDVVSQLVAQVNTSDQEKFERAVTSYLSSQYTSETEIKFTPVDFRQKLIDLFIDLPFCHKAPLPAQSIYESEFSVGSTDIKSYLNQLPFYESNRFGDDRPCEHSSLVAAFLLTMHLSVKTSRIVLEGAPGQGKSTVSQFLCQIHRIRLLRKRDELNAVSDPMRYSPIRIPFKLDLRDYATWLSGRDPFCIGKPMGNRRHQDKSLEGFLAIHIERHSGGSSVNSNLLMGFLQRSHVVIVLDGFDEVADVAIRKQIVDQVCHAAERIEARSKSVQFVITSRPTAFSKSTGFPEDAWTHLRLDELQPSIVKEYKEKWMRAHGVSDDQARLISETLEEAPEQLHFIDLARNPMQLSILLYLIHVQGVALRENRTALYTEYMNQCLNREAVKSSIVRDNRELLLSIHGALAFDLHAQAEAGRGSGGMSALDLRKRVKDFLEAEGHGTDLIELVGQLTQGTVERIGALVSRVPGTFEFEVQSLREYFAARHLHQTAPISSRVRERKGTRSDRFKALVRNSFWTNVTRFFCGFYDIGELSSLVDGITDLGGRKGYELINQPRQLAIMLLSDHVFSQVPMVTGRLMEFVTSEPGFQRFYSVGLPRNSREIELPEKAGRSMLFQTCLARLDVETAPCRRRALREIMAKNAGKGELTALWKCRYQSGAMICDPLQEAEEFGVIDSFPAEVIREITKDNAQLCVRWFMRLHMQTTIIADPELYRVAVGMLFDCTPPERTLHHDGEFEVTDIEMLQSYLNPFFIAGLFSSRGRLNDRTGVDFPALSSLPVRVGSGEGSSAHDSVSEFAEFVASIRGWAVYDLQQHLFSWSEVVDRGFAEVPGNFMMVRLAVIAVAGNPHGRLGSWSDQEFSPTAGLISRLFYARRKAADVDWWRARLEQVTDDSKATCLAALLVWGMPDSVTGLIIEIGRIMDQLPTRDWRRMRSMVRFMVRAMGGRRSRVLAERFDVTRIRSPRLAHVVVNLVDDIDLARENSRTAFRSYNGRDVEILQNAFDFEIRRKDQAAIDWDYVLRLSAELHAVGACCWFPRRDSPKVPAKVAEKVLRNCTGHCLGLVSVCEVEYSNIVAQDSPRLSRLAESDEWFGTPR